MPKYYVNVPMIEVFVYEVEADSHLKALLKVQAGNQKYLEAHLQDRRPIAEWSVLDADEPDFPEYTTYAEALGKALDVQ